MSQSVITVRNLTRRFGSLTAVDHVSFEVERGAIFGLLGPNGSGKSTVIRMLCGVLENSGGYSGVLGFDTMRQPEAVKRRIGYMSQKFSLYADLTVAENISFYGRVYGLDTPRLARRTQEILALTGLGDRLDQLAGTLSGGWKQRLALGCALIHEPEVLFLDEPTAGIDPVARRDLWDLLFDLAARGVTLLVTTHYMDEAERCSHIAYLHNSKLIALGKPNELKRLPAVTPSGTRRYLLEAEAPARLLHPLRKLASVRDATLLGQTIHLLADERFRPAEAAGLLKVEPGTIAIRDAEPTLEDVFVTLTRAAEPPAPGAPGAPGANAALGEPTPQPPAAPMASPEPPGPATPPPMAPPEARAGPPDRPSRATDGLLAILLKEFAHVRRQPATIFFMFVVPILQITIFGFAINTQTERIPTVVFNPDGRQTARELVDAFATTRTFQIVERVHDHETMRRSLTSGRAKVALIIPPTYSDDLLRGRQAQVQVLIDGSDSQVATSALNASKLLGVVLSTRIAGGVAESNQVAPARDPAGVAQLPIDVRVRLLFNPNLESSHFFVPGLVGVILQLVTLFLTAGAVVRERELGTLEQLFVTPVGRAGLLLGKLLPYAIVGVGEMLLVMVVMVYVFGVSINGSLPLLVGLSTLFLFSSLGLGLLISTLAKTQLEATQYAFIVMLPTILLSGFVFPRSQMPALIYLITFAIPGTYFIEVLRGVILRGADFIDLIPQVIGLIACGAAIMTLSLVRFHKQAA